MKLTPIKKELLIEGKTYKREDLTEIFTKVQTQGGMRRSKVTNSLLLISHRSTNVKEAIYEDRWDNDVLYYTGMGQEGNQNLDGTQNKTLNETKQNEARVFLFEVFKPTEYIYTGEVELIDAPFIEKQLDINENMRNVWIFPLKLKSSKILIEEKQLKEIEVIRAKKIHELNDNEIEKGVQSGKKIPSKRTTITTTYERNQYIIEYAKRKAKGICQLCDSPAPFNNKKSEPYLEVHHIKWLAQGGSDTIENVVALCPNCHSKMHIINSEEDIKKLEKRIK